MAKITFLGTCSGTEPIKDMHQCSIVFDINGSFYWFDCGENCGYSAFMRGIDVTRVRTVFISHMHIDHIGGFPHFLFTMDKMHHAYGKQMHFDNTLKVFVPDLRLFDAVKAVASMSFEEQPFLYKLVSERVNDGTVYEDENVKVTALHNTHLREDGSAGWHSYSYLIEAEGKRIVFSGDVGNPEELDPLIGDGCDILIMETGHHKVSDVCDFALSRPVGALYFNHHGREIVDNRPAMQRLVSEHKVNGFIAHDGMELEF